MNGSPPDESDRVLSDVSASKAQGSVDVFNAWWREAAQRKLEGDGRRPPFSGPRTDLTSCRLSRRRFVLAVLLTSDSPAHLSDDELLSEYHAHRDERVRDVLV